LENRLADTTAEVTRLRENLEMVRRDAMTDGLTKLANRKAFDEALERALEESNGKGQPLTLAVIDIDYFKKFNDTWGHQTGDQLPGEGRASLIERADAALYASKRGGRNRTTAASAKISAAA